MDKDIRLIYKEILKRKKKEEKKRERKKGEEIERGEREIRKGVERGNGRVGHPFFSKEHCILCVLLRSL